MIKKQKSTYSITEAQSYLDKYLNASAQRLCLRLKAALKKQSLRATKVYVPQQ